MPASYLAHHGVKGMKWGVRKDRGGGISAERIAGLKAKLGKGSKGAKWGVGKLRVNPSTGKASGRGSGTSSMAVTANQLHQAWLHRTASNGHQIISLNTFEDAMGYVKNDLSKQVRKLHRALTSNMYSTEQKVAVGARYIHRMWNDVTQGARFIAIHNPGLVLVGAAALTAAGVAISRKHRQQYISEAEHFDQSESFDASGLKLFADEAYLEHHGVKGQKWGVRRGPPYPIGSGGKPNPFNVPISSLSKSSIDTGKTLVGRALDGAPLEYGIKNPNAFNVIMDWAENGPDDDMPKPRSAYGGVETESYDTDLNNYAYEQFMGEKQGLELTPTAQSVYDQVLDKDSPLYERSEWEDQALNRALDRARDEAAQGKADWDRYKELQDQSNERHYAREKELDAAEEEWRGYRIRDKEFREGLKRSSDASYENLRPFAEGLMATAYEANAPRLDHAETSDETVAAINPKWGQRGYVDNCTGCSVTFDLRKRGYDVTAGEYLSGGLSDETVTNTFYKNAPGFTSARDTIRNYLDNTTERDSAVREQTAGRLLDEMIMEATPEGGRGMLNGCHYTTGGMTGHSIAYEVENGAVTYYDGQDGSKYSGGRDMVENEKFYYDTCRFMRTDNLEPNWFELGKMYRVGRRD